MSMQAQLTNSISKDIIEASTNNLSEFIRAVSSYSPYKVKTKFQARLTNRIPCEWKKYKQRPSQEKLGKQMQRAI